jgi:hypothetical protein
VEPSWLGVAVQQVVWEVDQGLQLHFHGQRLQLQLLFDELR